MAAVGKVEGKSSLPPIQKVGIVLGGALASTCLHLLAIKLK